jgi:acyl-CoA synthetase (AMP-forming)/AMP-acid ligase II
MPTYFLPRFSLEDFTRAIDRFAITDVPVVPPIIAAMNQSTTSAYRPFRSVRYVICAGASMNAKVQAKLYRHLAPTAVVAQCWGTTETGWITLFDWQEKDMSGSVGRLMPNVHLKLVGGDGAVITEEGVSGEAFIRTPVIFSGYLDNTEATRASFDHTGYYGTGDRVCIRGNKVFHVGRIKEVMKVKGWQVSPTEIEDVLLEHPMISDVAVVGIPSVDKYGVPETLPRAYVVCTSAKCSSTSPANSLLQNGSSSLKITEAEVQDFVASRLISYKRLTGGVRFVDSIPRSNTGKLLRRLLPLADSDDP